MNAAWPRWLPALLLAASLAACQTPPAAPSDSRATLLPFASDAGLQRLARATARADFAALANQFEAQSNALFCGPTSAAIVLNAVFSGSEYLPRDRSRLSAADQALFAGRADASVARFTQDQVISAGSKTRAQVLGEPMPGSHLRDPGYQLRQFEQMLRANGVRTHMTIVEDALPDAHIRQALIENLAQPANYVLVNYLRSAVGQKGGGHISPLGAYDSASDSFLVMDVNPGAAGWVWMPSATLIRGMRSFDTLENRGYILISPP